LRKSPQEAYVSEIGFVLGEIRHALRHLATWAKPERRRAPWMAWPARAELRPEPFGVALPIGPLHHPPPFADVVADRLFHIDIFPRLNLPVIYVCQPYGGMDPAQMEGLLANDVVSFHTERWRTNFLRSCEDIAGADSHFESGTTSFRGRDVAARVAFGSGRPVNAKATSGWWPAMIPAMPLPEPEPIVQPGVPWPVFRNRLAKRVLPIYGTFDGVSGRSPVQ